MNDEGARHPDIDTRGSDRAIALAKQVATIFPGIGPVVAQLLLEDIPEQRMDRIADYVRLLGERVDAAEFREKMRDAEMLNLFEEGASKSTRATTEERRIRIAAIVANGINGDEGSRIEASRLLDLLSQLDDGQVVILTSYLLKNSRSEAFNERHAAVLRGPRAHIGSSREDHDRSLVVELGRAQLSQLGLLKDRFRVEKGKIPEFDEKTGRVKAQGRELSGLGRLLLRRIGLAADEDF